MQWYRRRDCCVAKETTRSQRSLCRTKNVVIALARQVQHCRAGVAAVPLIAHVQTSPPEYQKTSPTQRKVSHRQNSMLFWNTGTYKSNINAPPPKKKIVQKLAHLLALYSCSICRRLVHCSFHAAFFLHLHCPLHPANEHFVTPPSKKKKQALHNNHFQSARARTVLPATQLCIQTVHAQACDAAHVRTL